MFWGCYPPKGWLLILQNDLLPTEWVVTKEKHCPSSVLWLISRKIVDTWSQSPWKGEVSKMMRPWAIVQELYLTVRHESLKDRTAKRMFYVYCFPCHMIIFICTPATVMYFTMRSSEEPTKCQHHFLDSPNCELNKSLIVKNHPGWGILL